MVKCEIKSIQLGIIHKIALVLAQAIGLHTAYPGPEYPKCHPRMRSVMRPGLSSLLSPRILPATIVYEFLTTFQLTLLDVIALPVLQEKKEL
jgi:hypothetical protein